MSVRIPTRINLIPIQRFTRVFLKKFITKHSGQHSTTYIIQVYHIDTPVFSGLNHLFIIVSITTVSSNASSQRLISSFYLVFCCIMLTGSQVTNSPTVTDNKTIESPLLTQNLLKQFRTSGNRNTHIIRVSHHQRLTIVVANDVTEWNQMYFTHFTFRQTDIM